jgi:hypothetical protein
MLRGVELVRTEVSEEIGASVIRVEHYVPPKYRFLQAPHGVTSQKKEFFIVTAVKTSNHIPYIILKLMLFLSLIN